MITVTVNGQRVEFSKKKLLEAEFSGDMRIVIVEQLAAELGYTVVDRISRTDMLEIFQHIESQLD